MVKTFCRKAGHPFQHATNVCEIVLLVGALFRHSDIAASFHLVSVVSFVQIVKIDPAEGEGAVLREEI